MTASETLPSTAVLIVAYHGRDDLSRCLPGLATSLERFGRGQAVTVVVDNASADGTADWLEEAWPLVDTVRSERNLGFAGGNNLGWDHIRCRFPSVTHVALLNQDTEVADDWLIKLLACLEQHPEAAAVQALLHLLPESELINTAGNRCHILGFGFMTGYRDPVADVDPQPREIDSASGAAVLLRVHDVPPPLFDGEMFMYLEDVELAWRLRLTGKTILLEPSSRVGHRYSGQAPTRQYALLERNRLRLLLTHLKVRTLLLLSPCILLMEVGQCVYALSKGLLWKRFGVYSFFARPTTWNSIRHRRRLIQSQRTVDDRCLLEGFTATIDDPRLSGLLVRWIANPLLGGYWFVARRLLRW